MDTKTYVLGKKPKWQPTQLKCRRWIANRAEIREAIPSARRGDTWVAPQEKAVEAILNEIHWPVRRKLGDLVVMDDIRPSLKAAMEGLFARVVPQNGCVFLPLEELTEVLQAENKEDLFIAGTIDRKSGTMTLWRGNLDTLVVPLSAFQPSGDGTAPDFDRFGLTDYGQTIELGPYQAAGDSILYEYDVDFRRRLNQRRWDSDKGLGPSLRRVRIQKGLRQCDFPGVSEKTIARIERGEVEELRARTRKKIAQVLGIAPDEIETY